MRLEFTENGKVEIYTEYNAKFVGKIKYVSGARFDRTKNCWVVDINKIDIVREMLEDVYGYSDITMHDTLNVKITIKEDMQQDKGNIVLLGKTLCIARGRDDTASAGKDVTYIKGKPCSGGSYKNWYTEVEEDSVILLENVSRKLLDNLTDEDKENFDVEIMENIDNESRLKNEREYLLQKLENINNILGKL